MGTPDLPQEEKVDEDVLPALRVLREWTDIQPEVALVLGSGLGALADLAEGAVAIPAGQFPGYPQSTAPGHQGRLIFGRLDERPVVFVQGRPHYYEGHSLPALTFPLRLVHAAGADCLLVTNAAGGINPSFVPGTFMIITSHLARAGTGPLISQRMPHGPMQAPAYDPAWIEEAERCARRQEVALHRGVYAWTAGPSYETKAEVRALARLGADAVGMSTVPEVLQARALSMRVLGLSTITNPAAGLNAEPLSHEDVLEVGRQTSGTLQRLIRILVGTAQPGKRSE